MPRAKAKDPGWFKPSSPRKETASRENQPELTVEDLRRAIQPLEEQFTNNLHRISEMSEEDTKIGYVLPLLNILGWESEGIRQIRAEVLTPTGHTDLVLKTGPDKRPSLLVEVKSARESLDGKRRVGILEQTFSEQAVRDAWQMKIDFAILTNYEETRLYYTHVKKPAQGLVFSIRHHKILNDLELGNLLTLARWNVQKGSLQQLQVRRTRKDVNAEVLEDLFTVRQLLVDAVKASNPNVPLSDLRAGIQRIIDRLIIIRTAEDRGTIAAETIARMYENWQYVGQNLKRRRSFFEELGVYFRDFDYTFNSAIFAPHPLERWAIDNPAWEEIIRIFYSYNFDKISPDVLGNVYEDYIGHVLQEEKTGQLVRVEDVKVQQEGGIYYTPTYIVDYIIWKTLGKYLEQRLTEISELIESGHTAEARAVVDHVRGLRVLDPACGSGSFLIKCFDYFADFYAKYNSMLKGLARPAELIHVFDPFEEHVLTEQLFGIDLDEQASEIAGVNMVLKALRPGRKLPLILDQNILTRNSLLFGDANDLQAWLGLTWKDYRPIDWSSAFHNAIDNGGFDFIVGNPPWGAKMSYSKAVECIFTETAKGQYDIWDLFVELSRYTLKPGGRMGFVLPATFFYLEHETTRSYLLKNMNLDTVVQCGEKFFPNVNIATCLIVFERKKDDSNLVDDSYLGLTLDKNDCKKAMEFSDSAMMRELEKEKGKRLLQRWALEDPHFEIQPLFDEEARNLKTRIESDVISWEELTTTGRGVELTAEGEVMQCPGCRIWDSLPQKDKNGGYRKKHCDSCGTDYTIDQALSREKIIADAKGFGGKWERFLAGEGVNRYFINQHSWIEVTHKGINYKLPETYQGKKLLVRKTGVGIMASIVEDPIYFNQVVFYWKKRTDLSDELNRYSLEYLLAVISSRLMLWWWYHKSGVIEWRSYAYVTQALIQQFPIRKIDWSDKKMVRLHDEITKLVQQALSAKGPIDHDLDWRIEDMILDLYGVNKKLKVEIQEFFRYVHKMRIVRELYPEFGENEDETESDPNQRRLGV